MVQADPSPKRFRELMLDEEPAFEDVLACVFDIQGHEVQTYLTLRDNPGTTVSELAAEINRDRSNVNRSLSTLQDRGLVDRERRLLDGGGHVYQYAATPLPEARELMHETLDEWTTYVHDRIEEFGQDTN